MRFWLQLDKMPRTCAKEFLELNWPNVHDGYLVSDICIFYNNQWPGYFNEAFCPFNSNGVATCYCNKESKLPFCKLKSRM